MFRSHSPYSPFFTSGLLSEPTSVQRIPDLPDPYSDFVFNDDDHYRSFLSLDLAETQSMRSLSLKRKGSSKYTARSSNQSRPKFCPMPQVPSRESLNSLPSPKPIPSITLPVPVPRPARSRIPTSAPRLPSLLPLPSLDLDLVTSPKRKSVSPKKFSFVSMGTAPSVRPSVRAPSSVSTHTRLRNRATALAMLEGRRKPVVPPPAPVPSHNFKNFMSMSDDDDDDADDEDDEGLSSSDPQDDTEGLFNPSFEPEDIVLPMSTLRARSISSSRPPHTSLPSTEEELSKLPGRKGSQKRGQRKSAKGSDWFPLKSFIDLYNDNDEDPAPSSWNWRSFIEVANVS